MPNPCYFRGKRRTTRSRPILANHLNEAPQHLHMLMCTLGLGTVRSTIKRSGRQIPRRLYQNNGLRRSNVMTLILISLLVSRRSTDCNVTCQLFICSGYLVLMSLPRGLANCPASARHEVLVPQLTFARETCRHSGKAMSVLPTCGSANMQSRSRRSPGDPDRLRPCD